MSLFRGNRLLTPAFNIISKSRYSFAHKLANSTKKEDESLPNDFFKENCILVDSSDSAIGSASKRDCHRVSVDGESIPLHRAFSVFLFNKEGDMLLQKRSSHKVINSLRRNSFYVSVESSPRFRKSPLICINHSVRSSDLLSVFLPTDHLS